MLLDERERIIASVFSRRTPHGALDEAYVAHIKIYEDTDQSGPKKLRYILLSKATTGPAYIHKSKLNSNGSFSVGKTWLLSDLRAIHVLNSLAFNITLSRTYRWQTDNQADQVNFLHALILLFRSLSTEPLRLEGVTEPAGNPDHSNRQEDPAPEHTSRPAGPANSLPFPSSSSSTPFTPASQTTFQSDTDLTVVDVPSINLHAAPMDVSLDKKAIVQPSLLHSPSGSSPTPSFRSRNLSSNARTNDGPVLRKDPKPRISFFDSTNQGIIERLLSNHASEIEGEEETAHATMSNVEEMLEGYDWASDDVIARKNAKGTVDLIEARLTGELVALENANIHSFLESDNRVTTVTRYIDEAIVELDNLDSILSSYKIHLNAVSDDILHIQSQNRGLQVQTQNQRALLGEIENLIRTVHVSQEALVTLTQESLEKPKSIERLEEAATELYKALQAGRDTDMAATMERLQEYRTHNGQFCKRLHDFLSIMFTAQAKLLLGETRGLDKSKDKTRLVAIQHDDIEIYLGRYSGLMLYLKEMDEQMYSKLCSAYFSAANELHATQVKELLSQYLLVIKKNPDDDQDQGFIAPSTTAVSRSTTSIRRAGTLIRSPIERNKEKDKQAVANRRGFEAFGYFLEQMTSLIYHENDFITDFLQINDAGLTFADYMGLDNYFRRQAARSANLSQSTTKLIRGAMDLIFGFLPTELKVWFDNALAKDSVEVIGMLAVLEQFMVDAEERNNQYIQQLLSKQHTRLKGIFDRHINDQLKNIEQTRLVAKKRRGVAHFVKYFPIYINRIESQLVGTDGLEIRMNVDTAYERIVQTMFDCLKQMAKLEGEGEGKGQLNYHVILIENMHHFVAETSSLENGSIQSFLKRAEAIYDENLNAYVKVVIRRPFARIIEFFEGMERLLKTKSANEVVNTPSYNKQALRKILKEYSSKDIRKHIDVLYKRVEKHFTEASEKATTEDSGSIVPGPVMVGVWKACEDELTRITDSFSKKIGQYYEGSGATLEYSAADVEAAFRRQRLPS